LGVQTARVNKPQKQSGKTRVRGILHTTSKKKVFPECMGIEVALRSAKRGRQGRPSLNAGIRTKTPEAQVCRLGEKACVPAL